EGDLPTSPKNPDLRPRRLAYDGILPETCALERQARQALETERGERLDDNAFVSALFRLALAGPQAGDGAGDRAAHQIVQYHCVTCGRGTQVGAGRHFDLSPAEVERARCDAEVVSLDPSARASQVIPKSVRRAVELRDGKRCRAPG